MTVRDWRLVVLGGIALGLIAYYFGGLVVLIVGVVYALLVMALRVWRDGRKRDSNEGST